MTVPPLNLFSPVDWYRTIRDQIQHEDNLIVQRLSWLMAAQSFLITGYAIIANASPQARSPLLAKQQDLLFNIIPGVACISDILISAASSGAYWCFIVSGELMRRMFLRSEVSLRSKETSSVVGWESSLRFFCHWFF